MRTRFVYHKPFLFSLFEVRGILCYRGNSNGCCRSFSKSFSRRRNRMKKKIFWRKPHDNRISLQFCSKGRMKSARSFFTGFSPTVYVNCYAITAEEKIRFLQRSCIACSSLACQEYSIIQVPTRKTSNFCLRVSEWTPGHWDEMFDLFRRLYSFALSFWFRRWIHLPLLLWQRFINYTIHGCS